MNKRESSYWTLRFSCYIPCAATSSLTVLSFDLSKPGTALRASLASDSSIPFAHVFDSLVLQWP